MRIVSSLLGRVSALHAAVMALSICAAVHGSLTISETTVVPRPNVRAIEASDEDAALARVAWAYFMANRLPNGLVSSAASFPATTMWDIGSQLAGMTAALELGLLAKPAFDAWMVQVLEALARAPLYRGELPNKAYNAEKLFPTGYGELERRREIGFSALDLGRLALWLGIVSDRFPEHAALCRAVTARWRVERLVRGGQLMGTDHLGGEERYNQEGRLGYEQYAAHGLQRLGLNASVALELSRFRLVRVEGIDIPVDVRDTHDSEAHNYVTSEPYILDGIESGFSALSARMAGQVLLAQARRARRVGLPTAWSEDNLDSAPWFVYNSIYVDGSSWTTLDPSGREVSSKRGSSLKAALGWHVLFRTTDTERTYHAMRWLGDPKQGVFAGYYEETGKPNKALTLNTNGIVLEALLFSRLGRPLEAWARGSGGRQL